MFRKVIVPYDSSKPADNAVKYAANLVKSLENKNCEVVLVHVIPSIPASPVLLERPVKTKKGETVLLSEYIKELYEEMQVNAEKILEKKKKEIEHDAGTNATIKGLALIGDSVSDKIVDIAKKEKADLIIIGNVGLSGLSKLKTLGSVSRAVSERAPCPVLIVR